MNQRMIQGNCRRLVVVILDFNGDLYSRRQNFLNRVTRLNGHNLTSPMTNVFGLSQLDCQIEGASGPVFVFYWTPGPSSVVGQKIPQHVGPFFGKPSRNAIA